jgi:hypothetical protein
MNFGNMPKRPALDEAEHKVAEVVDQRLTLLGHFCDKYRSMP